MVVLPSIRRKYMTPRIPKGATVPMSECVVTLASDSVSYTGGSRTVGVTVTWGGEALSVNADYTLSFANNVNVGPATVTVTGMGQFSGSVTKTFYIIADAGEWTFDITKTPDEPIASYEIEDMGSQAGLRIHAFAGGLIVAPCPEHEFTRYELPSLSSTSTGALSNMVGGGISMSGTHFVFFNNQALYHAEASSPNDLTGLYFSSVKPGVTTQASRKIVISGDGLHVYLIGMSDYGKHGTIYRHDLSTAYDFSTMSTGHDATISFGYATNGKYQDFCFSPSGRRMLWYDGAVAYVFALSAAWDVETAVLVGQKAFLQDITYPAVAVNDSGNRLYLADGDNNIVREYGLVA